MKNQRSLWIWLAVFATLLFLELPGTHLFDPDETRYAEIPREMIATQDWLTPRLNGADYFEKPPLLYWLNASCMKVFGENPFAARLPTRLSTLAVVALLIFFLGGGATPTRGLLAGLFYLSAPLSFILGRINLTDGLLTATLTLTFFSLRGLLTAFENKSSTWKWQIGVGVGAALAVMTKGLIGVVLPGLVAVLWLGLLKRWKDMLDLIFSPAAAIFLILTTPWFLLVEKANPGFLHFFVIHEHFQRYATSSHNRNQPFYFFIALFVIGFLPWTGEFLRRLKALYARARVNLHEQRDPLFFVLWCGGIIGFFSLSHSKLIPYILPAMPAAAALAAEMLTSADMNAMKSKIRLGVLAGIYMLLILLGPSIARKRSAHDFAVTAQNAGADTVVFYKTFFNSFPWVLKRPIPVVNFQGELASINLKDPEVFWTWKRFYAEWNGGQRRVWSSGKKMVVALRPGDFADFRNHSKVKIRVLKRNEELILLANFKTKM